MRLSALMESDEKWNTKSTLISSLSDELSSQFTLVPITKTMIMMMYYEITTKIDDLQKFLLVRISYRILISFPVLFILFITFIIFPIFNHEVA